MPEIEQELQILEAVKRDREVTQAGLALQLKVAIGSVNWRLKQLIGKGSVKISRLQLRKLHYFLIPSGIALKAKPTRAYMDVWPSVYPEFRQAARAALAEVLGAGYEVVHIDAQDAANEIVQPTCLEQGVRVTSVEAGAA